MAQHDYNIANDSGANVRADINNVLTAIKTLNSGSSAPSSTAPGMSWFDTSDSNTWYWKLRNNADDAWIFVGALDVATDVFQPMIGADELETYLTNNFYTETEVNNLLNAKVSKTGNETIAGIKTFSSFPTTPSSAPSSNYQVANKKYVDDNSGVATVTSTNNAIVRFNGTAGQIQNSTLVGITDNNELGVGTLSPIGKLEVLGAKDDIIAAFRGNGNYQRILLKQTSDKGNGTVDIVPSTVPGSGVAVQYFRIKKNIATGTTRHILEVEDYASFESDVGIAGNLSINNGFGSASSFYGCRAWLSFSTVTSTTIRGSGNVSSLVDNGIGDTRINFITAMPDINYSFQQGGERTSSTNFHGLYLPTYLSGVITTSSIRLHTVNQLGNLGDKDYNFVSIHR